MDKLKTVLPDLSLSLLISLILSLIANRVGYQIGFVEALPGFLILAGISLLGYTLSYLIPSDKISAILWISLVSILVASPISPISPWIIRSVEKVSIMALCTPILSYAGVVIAKDWEPFLKVGAKGIIVSIFVIAGTFFVSAWIGDLLLNL